MDISSTPIREPMTLAELTRRLYARPPWLHDLPRVVDVDTFTRARDEMLAIQRERGFPLATADIDRDNFLLRGIPVVMSNG